MKRFLYFFRRKISSRIVFLSLGIASTLWFLIRVIPKPSRAAYPCMRATAPMASAFILYLLSLTASVVFFRKFRAKLIKGKYYQAFAFIAVTSGLLYYAGSGFNDKARAIQLVDERAYTPNDPIGVPQGLHPGRVVWVWGEEATDEACTNSSDNWWFENTDQSVVDTMMHAGIQAYAGMDNTADAWDAIFRHFNSTHNRGDEGYTAGEKIYIKINITNSCCSVNGTAKYKDFERMDATPEVVLALLKLLVEEVGVAQEDIFVGDPFRTFHNLYWDKCHSVYPNIHYCDGKGLNGRHRVTATTEDILKFSDGVNDWRIPQEYADASYFINLPCLKSHDSGGITLAAKNHQGSVLQDGAATDGQSAFDMHYSLPDHDDTDGGHHRYRHLVDYMGHEHLGGKTLITIIDGIWAGKSWEGWVEKWQMSPFDDDYPNSLFFSQDRVAIESVCWDFLLEEYASKPSSEQYPYMEGTGDYLLQASDPANWPSGVSYDPEGDGSVLTSMGVYEHWNNAADMEYTVIDFVKIVVEQSSDPEPEPESINRNFSNYPELTIYPSPVAGPLNIRYKLDAPSSVRIELYDLNGKRIMILHEGRESAGLHEIRQSLDHLNAGEYGIRMQKESNGISEMRARMITVL